MTVERDWFWFWFWFYYVLWLASVFTLVLVLLQSSENRSIGEPYFQHSSSRRGLSLGELQFELFELRTPHRSGTYELVTQPDPLPLSYKTLVGGKATKLGSCERKSFLKNPTSFPGLDGVDIKKEHELQS